MASPRPPPSFFSLILDTSATTLKISSEFVTKHLKNKISKGPIIICADGGYSWKIKIKKIGENYYFDNGWTNVVKDVNFMFGDFVLFRLVDKYTFEMFVYGKNSCERSLPKKVKVEDDGSSSVDNVNVDVVNVDDGEDDGEDDDDDVGVDDDDAVDDDIDDVDDDVYEGKEEEEEDDDVVVVDIDGDDGNPFFISTISKAPRNLRLPDAFVGLPGINANGTIMLKNLDGDEWRLELRLEKVNQSEKLYISSGWADFQQSNDLREGDECIFKFITSEGKILLAKVTKKKRPARQSQPSGEYSKTKVVKRKRGRELHANGRDVESEEEMVKRLRGNDDDDKDEYEDEDGDGDGDGDGEGDNDDNDGNEREEDDEEKDGVDIDGNPFSKLTILKSHLSLLRLPKKFVGLPGINANGTGTIMLKNLKGEEWRIGLWLDKRYPKSEWYSLSAGMVGFMRSNDISVGDECILKFLRKEGKFCLGKVTKKQRPAWQPQPQPSMDNDNDNGNDNKGEDEDDDPLGIRGDPFFTTIIPRVPSLRLPAEFVGLPGINAGGTMILKNPNGEEWSIRLLLNKSSKSERYRLSSRFAAFMRSNNIYAGDKCVIKFMRNEGKFCLAKVTRKYGPAWQPPPCGDLSFSVIISKNHALLLPEVFTDLPGMKAWGTIMLKNLKGEEYPIGLRLYKQDKKSRRYYLSDGWLAFRRSNVMGAWLIAGSKTPDNQTQNVSVSFEIQIHHSKATLGRKY